MKAARFLGALALAALLVVIPSPANAVTIPPIAPGIPNPVNILPSLVKGVVNAPAGAANIAVLLATWAKDPKFWAAVKASQAGTATAAQSAIVAAEATGFKVPVGSMTLLSKANVVTTGLSIGMLVGNGAVKLAGFKDDQVCMTDGPGGIMRSVAAFTNGVDCTAYDMTSEAIAQANSDAVAGLVGERICSTVNPGDCFKFVGQAFWVNGNRTVNCWNVEGGSFGMWYTAALTGGGTDWFNYGSSQALTYGAPGFAGPCSGIGANGMEDRHGLDGILTYGFGSWNDKEGGPVGTVTMGTADPERHLRCTLNLVGGGSVSALSAPFHESDGAYAPVICPELPDGGVLESWDVDLLGGPDEINLAHQVVSSDYGDWATSYPECAEGACPLFLYKQGVNCFTVPGPCADWFTDPDKEATYTCRYGEHDVPLSQCTIYAPTFKPGATTTGQQYGDPTTGEAQQTSVPADQDTFNSGVQDPSTSRECFPTGWAVLNPVEWVMKPVQCALEWAFVPRASVLQTTTTTMTTTWDAKVGDKLGEIVAPFAAVPVMTGCSGMPVDIDIQWPVEWQIHWVFGYACDGPLQPLALAVRTVFSGLFVFMGVKLLSSYLGGAFGFRGFGGNGGGE